MSILYLRKQESSPRRLLRKKFFDVFGRPANYGLFAAYKDGSFE